MKRNIEGRIENSSINLKKSLIKDINMKFLASYIIANLSYLLIGSYIYFTKTIIDGFNYKQFSIGLKYLFILNILVFLVIIIKRKYKKNIVHIGIVLAVIFGIISYLGAIDKKTALEGCLARYEGISANSCYTRDICPCIIFIYIWLFYSIWSEKWI